MNVRQVEPGFDAVRGRAPDRNAVMRAQRRHTFAGPAITVGGDGEVQRERGFSGPALLARADGAKVEDARTAGYQRNGRDRRSGKPVRATAKKERVLLFGTRSADYIRASGHNGCIAIGASLHAKTGRIHGCTRTLRR